MKRVRIVNNARVAVKRLSRQRPGPDFPDTYDLYSVRIGRGDWASARVVVNSSSIRKDCKAAVVDMCQQLYESVL